MLYIKVKSYYKNEIKDIDDKFSQYKSIKCIKKIKHYYRFNINNQFYTIHDKICNNKDQYIVYYDENEYLAECLIYGDIIKNVTEINGLKVKYEKEE